MDKMPEFTGQAIALIAYYDGRSGDMNEVPNEYTCALSKISGKELRLNENFHERAGVIRSDDGSFYFWQTHETDEMLSGHEYAIEGSLYKIEKVNELLEFAKQRLNLGNCEEYTSLVNEFREIGWVNE